MQQIYSSPSIELKLIEEIQTQISVQWLQQPFSQMTEASMEGVSKLFRTSGKRVKPSLDLPEGLCGQFSLAEMKIATNNFNDKLPVGEGDFGSVYKGSIDDYQNRCNKVVEIQAGTGSRFRGLKDRSGVALPATPP